MSSTWTVFITLPLISAIALVILARLTLIVATVEGTSMLPNLIDGDRVLVVRRWARPSVTKGGVVLLQLRPGINHTVPHSNRPTSICVKRVVGVAGDTIVTTLDEVPALQRPHVAAEHDQSGRRVWRVPQGHVFVRGDNKLGSTDSLTWGPIPLSDVIGTMILKMPRRTTHNWTPPQPVESMLETGSIAPFFKAETLEGKTVSADTHAGRDLLLFFTSGLGCQPCRRVVPLYNEFRLLAEQAGVQMVLVSTANAEQTRAFRDECKVESAILFLIAPRASNSFLQDYRVSGTPAFCLIGADGRVQFCGRTAPASAEWNAMRSALEAKASTATITNNIDNPVSKVPEQPTSALS